MSRAYRIGRFLDPQPNDVEHDEYGEAYLAAQDMAASDENTAIAIWDGDETVFLFFGGERFRQA